MENRGYSQIYSSAKITTALAATVISTVSTSAFAEEVTKTATITTSSIMDLVSKDLSNVFSFNGAGYVVVAGGALALYGLTSLSKKRDPDNEPVQMWGNKKMKRSASSIRRDNLPDLGKLNIYFGSQTGTGEGFAKVLKNEAKKKGFDANVIDLEDFEVEMLQDVKNAVFVMSTYGEGDPTDSAVDFYEYIKNENKELDSETLSDLKYSVFGLGNSVYEHFNVVARRTDEFLEKLGANRVYELGIGDDNGELEEDFENWKEDLWSHFMSQEESSRVTRAVSMSIAAGESSDEEDVPYEVVFLPKGTKAIANIPDDNMMNASTRHYFTCEEARITGTKELRNPVDDGSTIQVEFGISDLKTITYKTADNLAILPDNDYRLVEGVAKVLEYDLDLVFKLEYDIEQKEIFPTPCSVRDLLTKYCDISCIPKKSVLQQLSKYCEDRTEKERLKFLCSKEGKAEFDKFVISDGRSLFEMITIHFPSMKVPLNRFIQIVPRLQPRYYTISSSSSVYPENIHATVAVVLDKLPEERLHRGVCSTYLSHLQIGQKCRIFVRPSTFRLPEDVSTPIVMIGPGTGIAPMRALLQERRYQRDVLSQSVGPNVLYFGCRERALDFIYEDELLQYSKDGTLTDLQLAFSREQTQKVYVQHLLSKKENAEKFWQYINNDGGYIYVCGATKMGADVLATIQKIIQEYGKMTETEAREYITTLQLSGRYVQELWAGA